MKNPNIILEIKRENGEVERVVGRNTVTYEGDIYYAKKIANQSTDFDSPYLRLGYDDTYPSKNDTDVLDFVANSNKAISSTYPERNNTDPGNTLGGEAVLTWKIIYDLGDLDAADIIEAAIVDDGTAPNKALCRFIFDRRFTVTPTDALTVYVNHALYGVS
jgi:hypothetical protein